MDQLGVVSFHPRLKQQCWLFQRYPPKSFLPLLGSKDTWMLIRSQKFCQSNKCPLRAEVLDLRDHELVSSHILITIFQYNRLPNLFSHSGGFSDLTDIPLVLGRISQPGGQALLLSLYTSKYRANLHTLNKPPTNRKEKSQTYRFMPIGNP